MSAPLPDLLHEFFERSVERFPENVALEIPPSRRSASRVSVTYAELDRRAERLRASLGPGVCAGQIVVLLLGRGDASLYTAQLAVLKSGAAYACVDPSFPDRFLEAVCADAKPPVVLTDSAGVARAAELDLQGASVFDVGALPAAKFEGGLPAQPADLAYVIYTSGTTGVPKGVMIEHRSIVNLVESDLGEFAVRPEERLGQLSSPAYDSSVEETWLAFAAGATLVVLEEETLRLGPDLVSWLRDERLNVLCPAPTLLRMASSNGTQPELPDLRLLYVGGEALTEDVVRTWAPGRRLVNGYGPTECTVTVVRGDVHLGEPVTIGRAVPGNEAWVLDEEDSRVLHGEATGELCIRGIGVARGYLGEPHGSSDRFVEHAELGRIYRTKDRVQRLSDGRLVYLGRIDAQVKVRGYRIELEAIEARLVQSPGVADAACTVQKLGGREIVAAHLVAAGASPRPSFADLAQRLAEELPSYMVPSAFGWLEVVPRRVSGKVDRASLPALELERVDPGEIESLDELETLVAEAFCEALGLTRAQVGSGADFFLDLGGDSLSAVAVVSALRAQPVGSHVMTRDVYEARSVGALANVLRLGGGGEESQSGAPAENRAAPRGMATMLQSLFLLFELACAGAVTYAATFELVLPAFASVELWTLLVLAPFALALVATLYAALSLGALCLAKRILIGRYRAGRTPVWGSLYVRNWIVSQIASRVPWGLFAGTALHSSALRALGARIGKRVHIHRGVDFSNGGWDLLELGDDVTLSCDATLMLSDLDSGELVFGPIEIKSGATLGVRASVGPGSVVERGGVLAALSWLAPDTRLAAGEEWGGLPARRIGSATPSEGDATGDLSPALFSAWLIGARVLLGWLMLVPLLALYVCVATWAEFDVVGWLAAPTWTPLGLALLVGTTMLSVPLTLLTQALCVRSLGAVCPGNLRRSSVAYLRVWLKSGMVQAAGQWLSGSLYWPHWLRLAGMRIGPKCEISSLIDILPECIEIGSASFLADGIYLGGASIHQGLVTIGTTRIGDAVFIGNHVVVPGGSNLPDGSLFGNCTVVDPKRHTRVGGSWFGHPPLELPRREITSADRRETHDPDAVRYLTRWTWETARFTLPLWPLALAAAWFGLLENVSRTWSFAAAALVAAPIALAGVGALLSLSTLALKWFLLGRAKPGQHALWSCWCSRWDFLYVAWQFHAGRVLGALEGTHFLPLYLRAMGVRIGQRVVLGRGFAQVVDPDMLHLEDDSTVNSLFQAHSFEDRVLKLDHVHVGERANLAQGAVIFYGANVGASVRIEPHAVVMKGEKLLARRTYSGSPCEPVGR